MSPKIKHALSLFVSTTVVLSQSSTSVYANTIEIDLDTPSIQIQSIVNETDVTLYEQEESRNDTTLFDEEISDGETTPEDNSLPQDDTTYGDAPLDKENVSYIDAPLLNEEIIENTISSANGIHNSEQDIMPYAEAINPTIVYTQITKSTTDRSGNGSESNPYNRFEDAVANVADGGTIVIKGGRTAFLNAQDELGQIPFIIDKNITICSDSDTPAVLQVRAAGILLAADVTFENIEFAFANKTHDAIFANGHTLELIDCTRSSTSRQIDLFAGSLYDRSGNLVKGSKYSPYDEPKLTEPSIESHGTILIQTTKKSIESEFGKVFAGSMNHKYVGNATIQIDQTGSIDLVSIHSCGADETIIPPNSMFDFTEPAPPKENADYTVSGTVNIELKDYTTTINGAGSNDVHVTLDTTYPGSYFNLQDINSLTLKSGTIIPDEITWKDDATSKISLSSKKSVLDLSKINTLSVGHFNGGGVLTLPYDGKFIITNEITGKPTTFETVHGAVDHSFSGPVKEGHSYIEGPSNLNVDYFDIFTFTPNLLQSNYMLVQNGTSWETKIDTSINLLPDTFTHINFTTKQNTLTIEEDTVPLLYIPLDLDPIVFLEEGGDEGDDNDSKISVHQLPFEFYISGKKLTPSEEYESTWLDSDSELMFTLVHNDGIQLMVYPNEDLPEIPVLKPASYEIVLSLPHYNLSTSTLLNIVQKTEDVKTSDLDLTIRCNANHVTEGTVGDMLTITAIPTAADDNIQTTALQDQVEFIINGQYVDSQYINEAELTAEVPITSKYFHSGSNTIKAVYGGSSTLAGSSIEKEFIVTKISPTISLPSQLEVNYTGNPYAIPYLIDANIDTPPNLYYSTNKDDFSEKITTPPVNAGTYYVMANLPEDELYNGTSTSTVLTINPVPVNISLSGTVINRDENTHALKVNASMIHPQHSTSPVGEILFTCVDSANTVHQETIDLSYGTAEHTFENLPLGNATITATYRGTLSENYTQVPSMVETFQVINNYIAVSDIELIAPELQFYVTPSGKLYKNTSEIKLPFTITPDDASNQSISWETSAPNIVTINPTTGLLEIKSKGNAIITARTKDGNFSHSCLIEVVELTDQIVPVESISLDSSSVNLDLNGTQIHKLTANFAPFNATNTDIVWKSKNDRIATVDDHGKITAKSVGRTQIIAVAKDGAKIATCDVQVKDSTQSEIHINSISLENQTLNVGERKRLTPIILPTDATDMSLLWQSNNPSIAEVTENGTIIARAPGEAIIQATSQDGSNITATCTVNVISPPLDDDTDNDSNTGGSDDNNTDNDSNNGDSDDNTDNDSNNGGSDDSTNNDSNNGGSDDNTNNDSNNGGSDSNNNNDNSNNGGSGNNNTDNDSNTDGSGDNNTNTSDNSNTDHTSSTPVQKPSNPSILVSQFKDLTHHWAKNDIQFALDRGLFKGLSDTHFGANTVTSRGMFITVLHRLAGMPQAGTVVFSDVDKKQYYADAIAWASSLNIVSGITETKFAPNQDITREQLVVMLYQYAKQANLVSNTNLVSTLQFKDAHRISNWSKEAVTWALNNGLIQGTTHNMLAPKDTATRAQTATILKRFIELTETSHK